jgi:hypothetical protein
MNHSTERRGSGLVICALAAFTLMYALLLIAAVALAPFVYVGYIGGL